MEKSIIPQQIIEGKIYLLRGKKVMLDKDLAALYGVETFRRSSVILIVSLKILCFN